MQVRNFVVDNYLFGDDHGFGDDVSFLEEGIIDSTGVLELVAFLENTFSVVINDQELIPDNLDSLVSIVNFIKKKRNGQSVDEIVK